MQKATGILLYPLAPSPKKKTSCTASPFLMAFILLETTKIGIPDDITLFLTLYEFKTNKQQFMYRVYFNKNIFFEPLFVTLLYFVLLEGTFLLMSVLHASLAIYHLISKACLFNILLYCFLHAICILSRWKMCASLN